LKSAVLRYSTVASEETSVEAKTSWLTDIQPESEEESIDCPDCSGPKENIFIEADKGRINQVISNLLNNAIRFTNEGIITAAAVPKNDGIVVSISDTGSGIDSEILPILFTKFATKSTMGTGLGLFISKSIIDAHGGKIWGKNNYPEGKGATFGFSLPYHNQRFV
jgi:signal transduction histidine kinase